MQALSIDLIQIILIAQTMRRRGLFANFVGTMFDFYGGMFRLTFFLPFTLLQVDFSLMKSDSKSFGIGMESLQTKII